MQITADYPGGNLPSLICKVRTYVNIYTICLLSQCRGILITLDYLRFLNDNLLFLHLMKLPDEKFECGSICLDKNNFIIISSFHSLLIHKKRMFSFWTVEFAIVLVNTYLIVVRFRTQWTPWSLFIQRSAEANAETGAIEWPQRCWCCESVERYSWP